MSSSTPFARVSLPKPTADCRPRHRATAELITLCRGHRDDTCRHWKENECKRWTMHVCSPFIKMKTRQGYGTWSAHRSQLAEGFSRILTASAVLLGRTYFLQMRACCCSRHVFPSSVQRCRSRRGHGEEQASESDTKGTPASACNPREL